MKSNQLKIMYFSSLIVLFDTEKNIINMLYIFGRIKLEYTFYFTLGTWKLIFRC